MELGIGKIILYTLIHVHWFAIELILTLNKKDKNCINVLCEDANKNHKGDFNIDASPLYVAAH